MSARRRKARRRWPVGSGDDDVDCERLARFLSDWCAVWEICGSDTCRRARTCRGPRLACYDTCATTIFTLLNEAPCMRAFYEAIRAAEDDD